MANLKGCGRQIGDLAEYLRYLGYLLRHKFFVFLECAKCGLWWRGFVHDASKFLPSEFFPYAIHFAGGIQAGRDSTGYYKPTDTGDRAFDFAWFLHQKRNKHHWQYWTVPDEDGRTKAIPIPEPYRTEMLCDFRGAGRAQRTLGVRRWYVQNGSKMTLSPETRSWLEEQLDLVVASGN